MKYRSFTRLIVQIIPDPREEISPGGIHLPETYRAYKSVAFGKVLDGYFFKSGSTKTAEALIRPGDTVAFSLSAPREGMIYFCSEEQIYAVLND